MMNVKLTNTKDAFNNQDKHNIKLQKVSGVGLMYSIGAVFLGSDHIKPFTKNGPRGA